jgi:hypothetical protein
VPSRRRHVRRVRQDGQQPQQQRRELQPGSGEDTPLFFYVPNIRYIKIFKEKVIKSGSRSGSVNDTLLFFKHFTIPDS